MNGNSRYEYRSVQSFVSSVDCDIQSHPSCQTVSLGTPIASCANVCHPGCPNSCYNSCSERCNAFTINSDLFSHNGEYQDVLDYILDEMHQNIDSIPAKIARSGTEAGNQLTLHSITASLLTDQSALIQAGSNYTASLGIWAYMVQPRGDWDHKSRIIEKFVHPNDEKTATIVNGIDYRFDLWSNIHYGYVGSSIGFSDDTLLYGAGVAQFYSSVNIVDFDLFPDDGNRVDWLPDEPYNNRLRDLSAFETYLDNEGDSESIQFGIDLWKKYQRNLTREEFLMELEKSGLAEL